MFGAKYGRKMVYGNRFLYLQHNNFKKNLFNSNWVSFSRKQSRNKPRSDIFVNAKTKFLNHNYIFKIIPSNLNYIFTYN